MILPEAYLFDEERIGALRESGLLTRDADPSCDRWTRLAHELTGAPIALMTVVTDEGQLFKSHVGLPPELAAVGWLPLTHSVCRHVVAGRRRFVAGDTRDDLRLLGHPVVAEHGIAAYAGHPLTLGDGHVVGALSVLDVVPREWSPGALRLLEDLAAGLDAELGLRTARRRLLAARRDLERQQLHDPATGLANRDCFTRDLRAAVKGDGPPLLGVFGLDAFRAYNEALGHAAGDALLEELAGRLRDAVAPAGGLAYRIAGDEFGVLVHDDTAISAAAAALRARGDAPRVGCAHGVVRLDLGALEAKDALLLAERRMQAMKAGRSEAGRRQAHDVLVAALEAFGTELADQEHAVTELTQRVGLHLGVPRAALEDAALGARLHGVGRLAGQDAAGTDGVALGEHAVVGERIVGAAPGLHGAAAVVRAAHERWDGAGVPDGLRGLAIPVGARITAVCGAYAAFVAGRRGAPPRAPAEALAAVQAGAGTRFDPRVVAALVAVLP